MRAVRVDLSRIGSPDSSDDSSRDGKYQRTKDRRIYRGTSGQGKGVADVDKVMEMVRRDFVAESGVPALGDGPQFGSRLGCLFACIPYPVSSRLRMRPWQRDYCVTAAMTVEGVP